METSQNDQIADFAEANDEVVVSEDGLVSEEEEEYEEESAEIDISRLTKFASAELDDDDLPNEWSAQINENQLVEEDEVEQVEVVQKPATSRVPPTSSEKGKGPYFCDICCKTFTNYGSYRRHLRMHYCDKKYTCHLCGRQFFRRYLWVKHQEKIHGNDPSSCRCPHCGDWSQSPDDLREHLRTQHKRTNGCKENWTKDPSNYTSVKSPISSSSSPVAAVVVPVKKEKRKKREPKTPKLKITVVQKDNLNYNIPSSVEASKTTSPIVIPEFRVKVPIKQETFVCYDCDLIFTNDEDLDDHRVEEHGGKRNTSRYGRRRKQRVLFNSDNYPAVPGSSKRTRSTSNTSNLSDELLPEEANETASFTAEVSVKQEVLSEPHSDDGAKMDENPPDSMLSKLLQQPLPNTMPKNQSHRGNFYCEKCRRFFINRSSYMRHKKMHTGIKPFTCEYCCLSFFRSESLTTHKKKHSKLDVPEYRCYVCGYKAANSASLRNHFYSVCCKDGSNGDWLQASADQNGHEVAEETSDNGTSPKKGDSRNIAGFCSMCNRAFFNLNNYQRHIQLHSNMASPPGPINTTYACGICNKSFTNKARYDEHVLAHSKRNTALDMLGKDVPTSLELLKQFGAVGSSGAIEEGCVTVKEEPLDEMDREEEMAEDEEMTAMNPGLNKGRVFCCRLCPLAFTDKKTYVSHLRSHRRSESPVAFYCRYCGRPHRSKQDVAGHEQNCYLERRSDNKMHNCYNCTVHFDNGSALREHVKAAHLNDRIALTVRSKKKKSSKQHLDENQTGMENDEAANFFTRQTDKSDVVINGADDDDPNVGKYKCGKCNDTFSGIQLIFEHFQRVHGVAQVNQSFSKVDKIASKNNPNFSANQSSGDPTKSASSRRIESSYTKERHSQHASSSGSSSSTSIMKQLLSSPPVASSSFRGNGTHSSNRSFNCNLCLKAFDDPRVAEAHEQQAHIMVDWYRCAICDKSGSKKALVRHMTSHMFKVGSVVTTVGDKDSEGDDNNEDHDLLANLERDRRPTNSHRETASQKPPATATNAENPLPFVSMFCQLCKKVISSVVTLERHRHAAQDSTITFPYICCMPGCGKSFALKVEAVAHLQTQHRTATKNANSDAPSSPYNASNSNTVESSRGKFFMGNSWKGLVAGGVGPFSQSLVQLSMAAAGNEGSSALRPTTETIYPKEDAALLDIYQSDMLGNLASNGELTITKVTDDVEQITVEPLVDVVRQVLGSDDSAEEQEPNEEDDDDDMNQEPFSPPLMDMSSLADDHQEYLEEGELIIEESPPPLQEEPKAERVLLKCDECQSVFTNPCSWKRHMKLHLGIMKHRCPHCPRMFYRKDHCDKHVKTHESTNSRKRKSPINMRMEHEMR